MLYLNEPKGVDNLVFSSLLIDLFKTATKSASGLDLKLEGLTNCAICSSVKGVYSTVFSISSKFVKNNLLSFILSTITFFSSALIRFGKTIC